MNAAELVALERVLLGGEVVARIQVAVAEELEERSVERVGRLHASNDVDHGARVNDRTARDKPEVCTLNSCNGVRERKGQIDVGERIVVVRAVHQVVDVGGLGARN